MELVDHPDGAAHLGAWYAIVEAASKQKVRGNLPGISQDVGGICRAIGKISQLPASVFLDVVPRLLKIGWLEEYQEENQHVTESPTLPGENPTLPGENPRHREGNGREGKGTTTNGTPQPWPSQTEWPLTTAELVRHDPATDQVFVLRLVQKTFQDLISAGDMEPFDDEDMATAIKESYEGYHGKSKHGNGLLLNRVPQIMLNWGRNDQKTQ